MSEATLLVEITDEFGSHAATEVETLLEPRFSVAGMFRGIFRGITSAAEWVFGVVSLVLGLSVLAALPLAQFLSMGYLLEASGRVAQSGRIRDGFLGVRKAARIGGFVAGIWITLAPLLLVRSFAVSADLIDPGGPISRGWNRGLILLTALYTLNLLFASARGGRLRYFLWPFGHPFWLARRLRAGGLYTESRNNLWNFAASLKLPYLFRLGLFGFLGTLCWLLIPAVLIGATAKVPVLGFVGVLLLAVIVPFLPFLQVHYAVERRFSALFSRRAIRERFRQAPWAFAFALIVLITASIPLYLLKIEMLPREAIWLPSLVFIIFLAPARLLTGWAYHRSTRRARRTHWIFRLLGRLAIIPVAVLYVIVVFFSQYISWEGVQGLYEQHAFLLPVPFFNT